MAVSEHDSAGEQRGTRQRPGLARSFGPVAGTLLKATRQVRRFLARTVFSSLARTIIVLNLAGDRKSVV